MRNEFELIERIKKRIPFDLQGNIPIGDDAGGFRPSAGKTVLVSTDAIVEGVDFRMGEIRPEAAGRKALAVNLSDMAAMGATPRGFVAAVGIPRGMTEKWLLGFHRGMMALAKKYSVACLGGDISRAREFFAAVTIWGEALPSRITFRGGARPGDWIGVTGTLGGSILGHHCRFEPRIEEGRFLAERFHPRAMIDLSDGLLQDLGHILKASGAGAELHMEALPVSADARIQSKKDGRSEREHALTDGEDFELLFAAPPAAAKKITRAWDWRFPRVRLSWIGKVIPGRQIRWRENGRPIPAPAFEKTGYRHF